MNVSKTYLHPSVNVLRATLSERKLFKVHSPRQPIRSLTVTVKQHASKSDILCPFSTLSPLTVSSLASGRLTFLKQEKKN